MNKTISIIIPAKNERTNLEILLPKLLKLEYVSEVLVVDDGSDDGTGDLCKSLGVNVVRHNYSRGNGAAIKTGARNALGDIGVFMDADGQHRPEDIALLLEKFNKGFDMVVGSRSRSGQASFMRHIANQFYNRLSSWMVEQKVMDLTSGFRVVALKKFRQFLYLLPNGFSYPTTITMSFFRAGYSVGYVPVDVQDRSGKSHVKPLKDGFRFLLIIFKIGTMYSPLKFFLPISLSFFLLATGYYSYTFAYYREFTNMSALLYITSVLVFLIGLVSEQVSGIQYMVTDREQTRDES